MGRELGVIGEIDLVDNSFTLNLDISVNVKLLARAVETSGRDTAVPCPVFYLRFKLKAQGLSTNAAYSLGFEL